MTEQDRIAKALAQINSAFENIYRNFLRILAKHDERISALEEDKGDWWKQEDA